MLRNEPSRLWCKCANGEDSLVLHLDSDLECCSGFKDLGFSLDSDLGFSLDSDIGFGLKDLVWTQTQNFVSIQTQVLV